MTILGAVMCRPQDNRDQNFRFQPLRQGVVGTPESKNLVFFRLDSGDRNGRDRNGLESAASKERQATPLTRGHSRAACMRVTAQPASKGDKMAGINRIPQGEPSAKAWGWVER